MADATSLHLRLPKRLYKRLQQQAKRNNVSLNTEIVNQLEGYEAATVKRIIEIMKPVLGNAILTVIEAYRSGPLDASKEELVQAIARALVLSHGADTGEPDKK
jgi:hypothetical protein